MIASFLPNRLKFTNNNPFPDAAKEISKENIQRVKTEIETRFRKVRSSFRYFESFVRSKGSNNEDFYKLIQYLFHISAIKSKQTH